MDYLYVVPTENGERGDSAVFFAADNNVYKSLNRFTSKF
jgi:hypothetical protein